MPDSTLTPASRPGSEGWAVRLLSRSVPAALLFCFVLLLLIHGSAFSGRQYLDPGDGDCDYYVKQAIQPFSVRVNPFAFRNLTPLLVQAIKRNTSGLLGWDAAWYLFTFALVYGSALLFYRFCRRVLNQPPAVACLAALILLANWVYGRFQFEIPFFPDPLNNFLWMLAFYLLFTGRWGWFYVTIGIGMLNKEVILFLVPLGPLFIYVKTGRLWTRPVLAHVAGAAAICGCYWAYRYGLGHHWQMQEFRLLSTNDWGILSTLQIGLNMQKSVWHLFNTFGFLWMPFLMMLYACRTAYGWTHRLLLASSVVFGICLFSRLYSTDVSRIFVMMAPLVVGLAVSYLAEVFAGRRVEILLATFLLTLVTNQGWVTTRAPLALIALAATAYLVHYARPLPRDRIPV